MSKLTVLVIALAGLVLVHDVALPGITINNSKSNTFRMTGQVGQVDEKAKTFTLGVTFNAGDLKTFPAPGEMVDVEYTQNPGGPPMAATYNGSKSNTYRMTAQVTVADEKARSFTVTADGKGYTFSAPRLRSFPRVGETIDIEYTQDGRGPMVAATINNSKSNNLRMTGKVGQVNEKARSFTLEVTVSAVNLKTLPNPGSIVDVEYTRNPDGSVAAATTVNSSKSNSF